MSTLTTRASSINRALDQVGDKWCLLIIQEVFWGINSFSALLKNTGVSRAVLSNRLKWLTDIDCLKQQPVKEGSRRMSYHLTKKSADLYPVALMALQWERQHFQSGALDKISLRHSSCGQEFHPLLVCGHCQQAVAPQEVSYSPGPGAAMDERNIKTRRRSLSSAESLTKQKGLYLNLINLVGDRWTANLIALSYHGLTRFDEFHRELPLATNILTERLKFLVDQGVFRRHAYQQRPTRYEYRRTPKGDDLYPFFLALLQWGDRWCLEKNQGTPMQLHHVACGNELSAKLICDKCSGLVKAHEVSFG